MAQTVEEYIIKITGDTTGLVPTIEALEELEAIDRKTAQAFSSATKDIENQSKAFANVTKNVEQAGAKTVAGTKSVAQLTATFKDLTKNIPNGALNELANDVMEGIKEGFADAGVTADQFADKLADGTDRADRSGKSLKAQLKGMKEELSQLEIAGKENTDEFFNLSLAAAKLEDQVGDTSTRIRLLADDSKGIKTAVEGVQGVIAAFSIAQGAQAIFGDESKELQETLVKLNAAMALLNGITTINTLIQKQSLLTAQLSNIQRRASAAAVNLETAAESKNIIIKYAAIAAQRLLNAVMAASPAGILITAFATLGAALVFLSQKTDDANEAIQANNEYLTESLAINTAAIKAIKDRTNALVEEAEFQRDLAIEQGSSRDEILKKDKAIDEARLASAENVTNVLIRRYGDLNVALRTTTDQLFSYEAAVRAAGDAEEVVIDGKKVDIKLIQDKIGLLKETITLITDAQSAETEATNQLLVNNVKRNNQQRQDELKEVVTITETKLLQVEKGSIKEYELRKQLIVDQRELDLAAIGITEAERKKILAQSNKDIAAINREQRLVSLNDQKAFLETELSNVEKNSDLELSFKIKLEEKKRQIELQAEGLTGNQRKLIVENSEQAIKEIRLKYSQEVNELANRIDTTDIKARLLAVQEGTRAELDLKLDLIDKEKEADEIQARATINDERELVGQLNLINQEALNRKLQLEQDFRRKQLQAAKGEQLQLINARAAKINVNDPTLSESQRRENNEKLIQLDLQRNIVERNNNAQSYMDSLKSEEDYLKDKQALNEEYAAKERELDNSRAATKIENQRAIEAFLINSISEISQSALAATMQDIQNDEAEELASLEKRKAAELANQKLTSEEKVKLDEKYQKEEAAIKTKAAKRQREAEVTQAEINGLLAITSILAQFPKFDGGIAMGLAIASAILTTGLQIKAIKSKPLPVYHSGIEEIETRFNNVKHIYHNRETLKHDEIKAVLQYGERVVDKRTNKDYFPALSAIHNRRVSPEVANKLLSGISIKPRPILQQVDTKFRESVKMDYEKIASMIQIDYKQLAFYLSGATTELGNKTISKLASAIKQTPDNRR